MAGVRVHNGVIGSKIRPSVSTFTDSFGRYTLTGLDAGTYTNGAFRFGYRIARRSAVTVGATDLEEINFTASALPQVSVAAVSSVPESAGLTNLFTFTRTGPTDQPLTIQYHLGGTAIGGVDYVRPLFDRIIIPAGAGSATLPLDIVDDAAFEADKTITVDVAYPSATTRVDPYGSVYTVYYPGWELADVDGQNNWVLTDPTYLPGASPTAAVTIRDNDPVPQTLKGRLLPDGSLELEVRGQPGSVLVLESRSGANPWTPVRTNFLNNTDTVIAVLPIPKYSHALYRTVRF